MRRNHQSHARPGGIPQPIAVTSDDLEMVVPRRHVTVKRSPPGIRLQPIRVQSLKPITEAHPLGSGEAEAGVTKLKTVFARSDANRRRNARLHRKRLSRNRRAAS